MRVPISIKLIIYFLLLSIVSIFILGKFSSNKAKEALIDRTFDQLISIRIEKEKRVQDYFNQCFKDISNIANLEATKEIFSNIDTLSHGDCASDDFKKSYIYGYLQAGERCDKIIFIDTNLNFYAQRINYEHNDLNCDTSILKTLFREVTKSNNPFLKEIRSDTIFNLIVGTKVFDNKNITTGVVFLVVPYEPIDNIMYEENIHNGLGESGEVYLVGFDSLMRSSSRFIRNSKFETKVNTIGVRKSLLNKPGEEIIHDYRGIKVFSSYKKLEIEGIKWVILAEIDESEAMLPINSIGNNITYLSLVISLLLVGLIAAISNNITSPIRKLQAETEKIYNGEYGVTIDLNYKDEIGDLINAFNKMSVKLKEQAERIEFEQTLRTSYVINGQEAERQRLSRELHDGLGQYILAIKLKLEHALSIKGEEQRKILEEIKELFGNTIKEIRNISNNLMPSVLTEYGIIEALENLKDTIQTDTNLNFSLNTNIESENLHKRTQIFIYRIVQEALNNTVKHSEATKFEVNLYENQTEIILETKDNGRGCDFDEMKINSGNGLGNIKERVNLLSGKIVIVSEKNKGFNIKIKIPK